MTLFRRNFPFFVLLVLLFIGIYHLQNSREDIGLGLKELHEKLPLVSHTSTAGTVPDHFDDSTLIETTIPGDQLVYGYSLLDRLYLRKGTLYIVTSTPSAFPERKHILSRPLDIGPGRDLDPTDVELQIINPTEAKEILGESALALKGFTLIAYDTEQFMNHFYHWWGEIILGAWRVYSAVVGTSSASSFASRVLLPHIFGQEWRDKPGLNAGLMRTTFPSTSIENADTWDDLALLDKTFVFERVMIVSRVAAHTHELSATWFKMISPTMTVDAAANFWEPVRRKVVQNLLGYLPELDSRGKVVSPSNVVSEMPFVTYIVRQGGNRRLAQEDHDNLVKSLKELEWSGVCQVYVAQMEKMSMEQQIEVIARSTVLIGVHGNGLTHELIMPPSPRSTVIEIFSPSSFIHDYEILARNLGHKHYTIWNDTAQLYGAGDWYKGINYGPDFHGFHGPTVADLVHERLTGPVIN
ncbi:hypothetical protein H0H92_008628 [Tricholoma furcatifolium]|nr:hypothetical protein H0H92_008628 [Tricholoma furcatifolium]